MEKFFKLKENGTDVKREVVGGLITFLTMAYIIAVNANILGDPGVGMNPGAVVTATCLAAGVTTILMGIYANLPLGLASGMGLNAFFAYTVVMEMGISWQIALTAVFVEGIIFILLSLTKVREAIVNCIPTNLKYAVTAGIGLFIAFIGFGNAGIVVGSEATKVTMGSLVSPTALITILGVMVIVILSKKNVKGAILWGMAASAIAAWIYAALSPEAATAAGIYLPKGILKFESIAPIAGKLDFSVFTNAGAISEFISVVFVFLFIDFFDTAGTLVGVASKIGMIDKDGKVKNAGKALLVDAIGTTFGALVGTSTVTTYVESSAGVASGARTGLSAVVTGILFLLAMFLSPLFVAIPGCATAPALIIVGFFMIESVKNIDFSDFTEGVPAFLTIALMPMTYSIGDGLMIGMLSYAILNLIANVTTREAKDRKQVSFVVYILAIIFLLKIIFG
ncbi:MAG: NCS2 family permease [Clostridium sulfidigenes]|uniref:NCS2 family permease n=1 Tax=Clostridium sulfidigenes TaxID=318464 RepID=A0A927WBF1_9CLOT|nr:NCS2 family permease [Clostridium sulfidigenes]